MNNTCPVEISPSLCTEIVSNPSISGIGVSSHIMLVTTLISDPELGSSCNLCAGILEHDGSFTRAAP
ncbi:hypothetical protein ACGC1H_002666 [Rhizoctonia solani]